MNYTLKTPVLLVAFNRPEALKTTLHSVLSVRPSKIYVSVDGPRKTHSDDNHKISAIREILKERMDQQCQIVTKFNNQNLGCAKAVTSAIDWLFEFESSGIILEDDCVPDHTFFEFCTQMLEKYADNNDVWTVSGDNFQKEKNQTNNTYFFSKYFHCWGWATWSDRWHNYRRLNTPIHRDVLATKLNALSDENLFFREYWLQVFDSVESGEVNSWAYPLLFRSFLHDKRHIHPSTNLVDNIGFGFSATHTVHKATENPRHTLCFPLQHPTHSNRNIFFDQQTDRRHFNIRSNRLIRKIVTRFIQRQLKRFF